MRQSLSFTAAVVLIFCSTAQVQAEMIKFYYDPMFVDTTREAPNMLASLSGKGHTINIFSGTTDAAFANAVNGTDVLVIPELEKGDLFGALSATAKNTITNFVHSGGRLVVVGDMPGNSQTLLNKLFGFSLAGDGTQKVGGSTMLDDAAAAGTLFAGGPAVLPNADGTTLVNSNSLPTGSKDIYHDANQSAVFQVGQGSGQITYLGYDWWLLPVPGEWNSVLGSSVSDPASMPEPASLTLFGLGCAGLIALRWRRRSRMAG